MKLLKIYIVLSGLITLLVMNSCSDVLDMSPDGYLTLDDIFQDNDKTGAYLSTCYEYIPEMGGKFHYWSRGIVNWSDEAWDSDSEAGLISGRLYNGNASASNHPILNVSDWCGNGNYWERYWAAIRKCTLFLTRIDGANVTLPADKKRWKAEAHVLRAFYYSELLRWFGTGLPIIREVYSLDEDFSNVQKPSYYETIKFIMEDCDEALKTSDLPWRITTQAEAFRVPKAMAAAIKSRMILYAASPLYNDGQNYWEEAYTINKQLVKSLKDNGYELYSKVNYPDVYKSPEAHLPNDYAALYNEYFTQSMQYSATPADRETIYQNSGGQGAIFDYDGIGINGMKSGTCPSQELVDAYETVEGANAMPVLNLDKPYLDEEKHLQPNYNSNNNTYDPVNPYENRDPRFYGTMYYNGSQRTCYWRVNEVPVCYENYPANKGYRTRIIATYPEEPYTGVALEHRNGTRTGYYERKFLHPNAGADNSIAGAQFKMFRLGEVILNYAEAAAEAGHLADAHSAVNEIRKRVGMPDLPSNLTQKELILRIHNERRIELALEGFRYFDVRRWSGPQENLAKTDRYLTAIIAKREVDSNGDFTHYSYTRQSLRERLCYQNKYLWVPIPANDVNLMEQLTGNKWQNPGW